LTHSGSGSAREWLLVHQVGDGDLEVLVAVVGDVDRDDGGGDPVGPPQAEPDADHPEHGGAGREPVGPVHLGVGEQHLVVQLLGQRLLGPAQEHRRQGAVGERREHQPAQPDGGVADGLDQVDRRVLELRQLHDRVVENERAEGEQRHRRAEERDRGDAVVAVGELAVGLLTPDP
jgi:hypothetical protein